MRRHLESGFSYIDVMIALSILLVGVLALAAAMTGALVKAQESDQQLKAKELASSSIESVFAVRDIKRTNSSSPTTPVALLGFERAKNYYDPMATIPAPYNLDPASPPGVFLTGFQPVYPDAGIDGIIGTADDGFGPNGVAGGGDDPTAIAGYQRRIVITPIDDVDENGDGNPANDNALPISLREVDVTIRYTVANATRELTMSTMMANYKQDN